MFSRKATYWLLALFMLSVVPGVFGCVLTFAVITLVIGVHEFGHWVPARALGVGVIEFAIGFGRAIYTFPRKVWGTTFVVRNLPLGGYIKPVDSQMQEAAIWKRGVFLAGGPLANILSAALLVFFVYAFYGKPTQVIESTSIKALDTNVTVARDAGLKPGDQIVSVAGRAVVTPDDVVAAIKSALPGPVEFKVRGRGSEMTLSVQPNSEGRVGIIFGVKAVTSYRQVSAASAFADSLSDTVLQGYSTLVTYGKLLHVVPKSPGEKLSVDDMQSIVGIVQSGSAIAGEGMASFLMYVAMISIAIGVANLLPLPGLDGGQLLFLAIEKVRGRPLTPVLQAKLSVGTFVLIGCLSLYVIYNDFVRIVGPILAPPIFVSIVVALVMYIVPHGWWARLKGK